MKRIAIALAAAATLFAAAPASAGDLDSVLGDAAKVAIGQILQGVVGGGNVRYQERYEEPTYSSSGGRSYGRDVFDDYDRYADALSGLFGGRKVNRCGRNAACAENAVNFIQNRDNRRLTMLFDRID